MVKKKKMFKHIAISCIVAFLFLGFATTTSAFNFQMEEESLFFDMNRSPGDCRSLSKFITYDPDNEVMCTITGIRGKFEGGGEYGYVKKIGNAWFFKGNSCQPGVGFWVSCFSVTD